MTTSETAREYIAKLGWSIIPCKKDKHPFIAWNEFNDRLPTTEEVDNWEKKYHNHNIALVTGNLSGVCIIDVDTTEGRRELQRYVSDDIRTPMVSTPSLGLHLYFKMPTIPIGNAVRFLPGVDVRAEHGYAVLPPSVGASGVSYEWLPGLSPFEVPVAELPPALLELLVPKLTITQNGLFNRGRKMPEGDILVSGRRDEDLFHAANGMIRGGMSYQETLDYLLILASRCDPPFSQAEARAKVDSAIKRAMSRERSIGTEIQEWIGDSRGWFSIKDAYHQLGLNTRSLQKIAMATIHEMIIEKAIEQHGSLNGMYRKIMNDANFITLEEQVDPYMDIAWPFQIENYVLTLPKSIAIVAGTPNSGKSALLLNVARMNQDNFKVRYFSSEMGKTEIITRVKKFGFPLNTWKVEFLERSENFADLIIPNGLNIIDFLEVHTDFFAVGGEIKKIFDALDQGLAVIALQRNPGAPTGIGGFRSMEKPRLYLNMDHGKIQIAKAKNWAQERLNPNGLKCEFNIVNGCSMRQKTGWTTDQSFFS